MENRAAMETRKFLLTHDQIQQMSPERKVHFLNPKAVRMNRSLGDAVGLQNLGVHFVEVAPGCETAEPHIHHYEDECFYVVSGRGTLYLGEDCYPVATGDFVGLPHGAVVHNLVNDGDQTLVFLVVGQRLQHEVADYPDKGRRLYKDGSEWNLVDVENLHDPRK